MPSCPLLPLSEALQQELCKKAEIDLDALVTQSVVVPTPDIVRAVVDNLYDLNKRNVFFKVLVRMIKATKCWNDDSIRTFMNVLRVCPNAAKVADDQGYHLIHHLAIIDDCPSQLMRCVIASYPPGCAVFITHPQIGHYSPAHFILLKPHVDLELFLLMLLFHPACARCETVDGKLPLHLVLQYLPCDNVTDRLHCKTIQRLLSLHPEGIYKEVEEERRRFRFDVMEGGYTMIVDKHRWCPLSKSEDLDNKQVSYSYSI